MYNGMILASAALAILAVCQADDSNEQQRLRAQGRVDAGPAGNANFRQDARFQNGASGDDRTRFDNQQQQQQQQWANRQQQQGGQDQWSNRQQNQQQQQRFDQQNGDKTDGQQVDNNNAQWQNRDGQQQRQNIDWVNQQRTNVNANGQGRVDGQDASWKAAASNNGRGDRRDDRH